MTFENFFDGLTYGIRIMKYLRHKYGLFEKATMKNGIKLT